MPIVSLETDRAPAVVTIRQSDAEPHQRADVSGIPPRPFAGRKRPRLLRWRRHHELAGDIEPAAARDLRAVHECLHRFERLPLPVVAAVRSLCFGGGLEFAIRADMILVGETSRSTCRCSRPMTRAAASGRRFEGAPSHGSDHELITCRYETSL
jgi:hypothetical protein